MRRVMLMLAAMAMMVSLFAAVAYAASIAGTDQTETLDESNLNDTIAGRAGGDTINAFEFAGDTDKVNGNRGADTIDVSDGDNFDTVKGGKGADVCIGDVGDELDCSSSSDTEVFDTP
jgi:Ca2+-binding RTX toxin-like protein